MEEINLLDLGMIEFQNQHPSLLIALLAISTNQCFNHAENSVRQRTHFYQTISCWSKF